MIYGGGSLGALYDEINIIYPHTEYDMVVSEKGNNNVTNEIGNLTSKREL